MKIYLVNQISYERCITYFQVPGIRTSDDDMLSFGFGRRLSLFNVPWVMSGVACSSSLDYGTYLVPRTENDVSLAYRPKPHTYCQKKLEFQRYPP